MTNITTDVIQEHTAPFMVHKFKTTDCYLWDCLRDSTLYFSAPAELNDPFDCQIDLMKVVQRERESINEGDWRGLADSITKQVATCGVFSFFAGDMRGDSAQVMWSHYGDNHKGVCLTYEIPESFVHTIIGCSPVTYGDTDLVNAIRNHHSPAGVLPIITSYFTAKSPGWAYESEGRLISDKPGSVLIERDWLHQICFGLRTPPEVRDEVIRMVKECGYTKCQIAEMAHGRRGTFDLEVRLVDTQP